MGDGFEVSVPAFEFDEMKQVLLSITHRIRHFLSAIDTTESEWSEWVNSTRSTVYVVSEESLTRWRIALVLASTGSDTEYKLVYIYGCTSTENHCLSVCQHHVQDHGSAEGVDEEESETMM